MDSTFMDIFWKQFKRQSITRLISFFLSSLLLRYVSLSLIGLINIRMMLLYSTIKYFACEPYRKLCTSSDLDLKESKNYINFIKPYAFILTISCSSIWYLVGCHEVEYNSKYPLLILVYAASALMEVVVEPAIIYTFKTKQTDFILYSKCILATFQKGIVLAIVLLSDVDHVYAFCVAQFLASLTFTGIYLLKWKNIDPLNHYKTIMPEEKQLLWPLIWHSIIQHIVNESTRFIMLFTNGLSFELQGVYDTVVQVGSIVNKVIFLPLKDAIYIYFTSKLEKNGISSCDPSIKRKMIKTVFIFLKIIINLSFVFIAFVTPYSFLLIRVYGGPEIIRNDGQQMLKVYFIFTILFSSVNKITESFVIFATKDANDINSRYLFLCKYIFALYALSIILFFNFGIYGLIAANCINLIVNIFYNGHYISKFCNVSAKYFLSFLPTLKLASMLFGSTLVISISAIIFGSPDFDLMFSLANISVGGVLFLGVMNYLHQTEHLFKPFLLKNED